MTFFLDADFSVLIAQVRKADASHKIDLTTQLLRSKHFQGPSSVVYLGDVAKAVLAQLAHPDTPFFSVPPKYNEQVWTLETVSSELHVKIQSLSYWGWGFVTSGYLNIITITGPLTLRSRLVLDVCSALGQSPWEMSHPKHAVRLFKRKNLGADASANEHVWKSLCQHAREHLDEAINLLVTKQKEILTQPDFKEPTSQTMDTLEDDFFMAKKALAEDNTRGVERALARLEATLIHLNSQQTTQLEELQANRFTPNLKLKHLPRTSSTILNDVRETLEEDEEVPFVDLTSSFGVSEEE